MATMTLSDLLSGGFSGRSGADGDFVRANGRLYKKTSSGLMDVETGEFAGSPYEANAAVMGMTPDEQRGTVNLPTIPQMDKASAFRMTPEQAQQRDVGAQGGGTVNGMPVQSPSQAENFFQRAGGERVTLRPDTGWTTESGQQLAPSRSTPQFSMARKMQYGSTTGYLQPDMRLLNAEGDLIVDLDPGREARKRKEELGFAKQEADIAKTLAEAGKYQREGSMAASGMPAGMKLKPGEVWDPERQGVRALPGSDLYIAQKKKHEADRDALKGVLVTEKMAIDKVDSLLSDENLTKLFGPMYTGQATRLVAPDAQSKLNSLKSNLKNAGLQLIRSGGSIGQMTQQEWPIVEQMIDSLDNSLSEEEGIRRLQSIKAHMQRMGALAREGYESQWADSQYFKPVSIGGEKKDEGADVQDGGATMTVNGQQMVVVGRNQDGTIRIRDPKTGRTGTVRP